MNNLLLCVLLVILAFAIFMYVSRENFSNELTFTNEDCKRMTDIYYKPTETDLAKRTEFRDKICGNGEISTINWETKL